MKRLKTFVVSLIVEASLAFYLDETNGSLSSCLRIGFRNYVRSLGKKNRETWSSID